ncbi:MAG: YjjG family noncanonical pyrimidine nucleotidase [Oscillospiraceae bacterium]|nr:YjjG family noncanonical pyrimidine nucleotidase [Oscillospiraceae bacterium]
MIEFLFLDLDDTILDFKKAEHIAIRKAIAEAGVEPTDEICARYSVINKGCWERLERGEWTREEVLQNRFGLLFEELGLTVDKEAVARNYERLLGMGHWYLPGAEETVKQILFGKYRLFLASNGTASVQHGRLTSAGLYPYFEQAFVSQEIGHNKPSKAYFDACFARIPGFDREKCLMVGDSLTSDILGGINAGIKTVWVNPEGRQAPAHIQPDYQIGSLAELPELLEKL